MDNTNNYGGTSDLWGKDWETWTEADVNAANFGVVIAAPDAADTPVIVDAK